MCRYLQVAVTTICTGSYINVQVFNHVYTILALIMALQTHFLQRHFLPFQFIISNGHPCVHFAVSFSIKYFSSTSFTDNEGDFFLGNTLVQKQINKTWSMAVIPIKGSCSHHQHHYCQIYTELEISKLQIKFEKKTKNIQENAIEMKMDHWKLTSDVKPCASYFQRFWLQFALKCV